MSLKKLISHRGNISGPNISLENDPTYILEALSLGYDCEVDIWLVEKELYLGHDEPTYKTSMEFLSGMKNLYGCIAKILKHWNILMKKKQLNYFWHQEDNFTLTSKGYIWTYPGNVIGDNSVIVDNEKKVSGLSMLWVVF